MGKRLALLQRAFSVLHMTIEDEGRSTCIGIRLLPEAPGKHFLHLIPDEKFIDDARAIFEQVAPGTHDYLLVSESKELRYIHSFKPCQLDLQQVLQPEVLDRF